MTPIYKVLGPIKYLAYCRLRCKHGAAKAREMMGLGPRTRQNRFNKGPHFWPQTVPTNQPAQVCFLYEEINRQRIPGAAVLRRAGVGADALGDWRAKGTAPRFGDLEAIANVLGFTFAVVPLPTDDPS